MRDSSSSIIKPYSINTSPISQFVGIGKKTILWIPTAPFIIKISSQKWDP